MNLCLLLSLFIVIPIITIIILVTTNIRSNFLNYNQLAIAAGIETIFFFFFLFYIFARFDALHRDLANLNESILYLKKKALKYEPSLIGLLAETLKIYKSSQCQTLYPIYEFEERLTSKMKNSVEISRVSVSVSEIVLILNRKFSNGYIVPEFMWYLLLTLTIILTIIYPLEANFTLFASILVTTLIWLPIVVIVIVYVQNLFQGQKEISRILNNLIKICSNQY